MATVGLSSSAWSDAAIKGTARSCFLSENEKAAKKWEKTLGFEEAKVDSPYEEYMNAADIGLAPRKEEFAQVATDTPKQGYTMRLYVLAYAVMIGISEEMIRYLRKGKMSVKEVMKPTEMVARSLAYTNEVLASDVYGNAFDTNFTGKDGQPLISTAHKLVRGGTASNKIGTVSFSQSSLEAALIQRTRFVNELGLPIGARDGKTILVLPPEYMFEAKRILQSTGQSNTANNAINALKDEDLDPRYNQWLPSTTNWFIRNMGETDCLYANFETKAELRDFSDDKTHAKWFQAYQNVAFGFGLNWRGVMGSDF